MNFTAEQTEAINKEGTNIIVSAGAGSGKTAVLSERVLRKLKSRVDIRNILILTFTNEAAGEMKNRIRKKIKKANLTEQLEYIDVANITTFDAYALGIVKKYHYLLGIGKNISIIDSSILDLEKLRILDEIMSEYYAKKDARFLKLIGDFTVRDDEQIKDAILNINKALDLKYDKNDFLNSYLEDFYNDSNIDKLFKEYFSYLKNLCEELENNIYEIGEYLEEKLYVKVSDAYSIFFKPNNYNDLYKIKDLPRVQFRGIPEEALDLKENIKTLVTNIQSLTIDSEEELKNQIILTKDYVSIIIEIILELDKRLNSFKYEKETFEFSDIAKMAIKIVSDNEIIREEIKHTYNEIMIDEYQDTNDLQETFISKIENNNVYMVGDIKQSIYRFRNANPNIFKNKYDNYSKHINGEKIDLLKNFRSREEVLSNINEIFSLIMTERYGGVDYKNNHEMVYGNLAYINEGKTNYSNDLEILKYDNKDSDFNNVEVEAFTIVKDIKNKIQNKYQVYDFEIGKKRDILFSDFCIILDRGTDMPTYKKIFEYFGIPMDVYKDSNLVNENDILVIKNIVSLILAIKNKEFDTKMRYYFVSIARSFIGDLSDAEILNYIDKNTFYDSIIYKKCDKLARDLDNKTAGLLLEEIIENFKFYECLIKVGNISNSIKRLHYLIDLANMAEDLGFSIIDFKEYLEKMVDNRKEIRQKQDKNSSNSVKIMNIHKSKGLEFPICYFAGFKKNFNLGEIKEKFLYDNKYGILTPYFKDGIGTTFIKTLIKNNYETEEISEKIRLFYVALTRAKEKMIMVIPEFKKPLKQNIVVNQVVASKYRSFYDFISSIAINLNKYIKPISLDSLDLTKDYEFSNNQVIFNEEKEEIKKIEFKPINIEIELEDRKHASKKILEVLNKSDAKTLEYGTKIHEELELINFKEDNDNKYINALKAKFDFNKAIIYQELEFYFTKDVSEYHGIIDLMLEYDNKIIIIDYKLKNI
ncbi:MAG: UvrD-helicase domain-containing protein, partial [Bacilli bacterium]|nr:UvrD-helicase domain-containing protein [Bacilli bacterium]